MDFLFCYDFQKSEGSEFATINIMNIFLYLAYKLSTTFPVTKINWILRGERTESCNSPYYFWYYIFVCVFDCVCVCVCVCVYLHLSILHRKRKMKKKNNLKFHIKIDIGRFLKVASNGEQRLHYIVIPFLKRRKFSFPCGRRMTTVTEVQET